MDRYQSNLVWIDLEMSGLDISKDSILEIAVVVTNNQLDEVITGPSFVIQQPDELLAGMDEWNTNQHTKSGLVNAVRDSSITLTSAQDAVVAFLESNCQRNIAPLCGNSVWQDKIFLDKYMPKISKFLHYRIIDVSSIKEAIKRWYPANPYVNFVKTENHRAQEDILQSIEELKHYRQYFFI